jgi:hypothetical protein
MSKRKRNQDTTEIPLYPQWRDFAERHNVKILSADAIHNWAKHKGRENTRISVVIEGDWPITDTFQMVDRDEGRRKQIENEGGIVCGDMKEAREFALKYLGKESFKLVSGLSPRKRDVNFDYLEHMIIVKQPKAHVLEMNTSKDPNLVQVIYENDNKFLRVKCVEERKKEIKEIAWALLTKNWVDKIVNGKKVKGIAMPGSDKAAVW